MAPKMLQAAPRPLQDGSRWQRSLPSLPRCLTMRVVSSPPFSTLTGIVPERAGGDVDFGQRAREASRKPSEQ
eukprot:753369-Pyramimonas_sp.AAC.1